MKRIPTVVHKAKKVGGSLFSFSGGYLAGIYRVDSACGEPYCAKTTEKWDRVTCKKCLRKRKDR